MATPPMYVSSTPTPTTPTTPITPSTPSTYSSAAIAGPRTGPRPQPANVYAGSRRPGDYLWKDLSYVDWAAVLEDVYQGTLPEGFYIVSPDGSRHRPGPRSYSTQWVDNDPRYKPKDLSLIHI